jgi:hypothetical protein
MNQQILPGRDGAFAQIDQNTVKEERLVRGWVDA